MTSQIFLHIPAYREPELIPTIESALRRAANPERLVFGICRQFHPQDNFDNLDAYRSDPRFKIVDIPYQDAKGLPYARALINEELLDNEEYVLQLDSHHRFIQDWDSLLIQWHSDLEEKGHRPVLTGYLPAYYPSNDPQGRVKEPWKQRVNLFFRHGTIFIQPVKIDDWQSLNEPVPSRFISGHFAFARNQWAKTIRHDPHIFFSGEELNLTLRSFTHGYDLFHPHRLVVWHDTMRENRAGKLVWDDMAKTKSRSFGDKEHNSRQRLRAMLGLDASEQDLSGYELGTARSLRDYERYAGIHFEKQAVQAHTFEGHFPPNPPVNEGEHWEQSFRHIVAHHFTIQREDFPDNDYTHILLAFDDTNGKAIKTSYIQGRQLAKFILTGKPIEFHDRFLHEKKADRVVYWAYSETRGWLQRKEVLI